MPNLKTRKEIIDSKKIICSELAKIQQADYDEDILEYFKENKQEALYNNQFDCINKNIIENTICNKIISIDHPEISTFTTELTKQLKVLFQLIDATEFIVITHLKVDFFGNRENTFEPLVNAYKKLEKLVQQDEYKGAFIFNIKELEDIIEILFWITRCDPSAPKFVFLFDIDERLQINLCKYGNIHVTEFDNSLFSDEMLISSGWQLITGPEYDHFSDDGKIIGRQIVL